MTRGNKAVWVIISLLISAVVFILTFFLVYNLACMLSPPYLEEANDETHTVMPIGQVMIGLLVAAIICIISLFICYKRFRKNV